MVKYQRYLSWDCANKTLAYTHFVFNVDIMNDLARWRADVNAGATDRLSAITRLTSCVIVVLGYEVIDLLDGRKVAETTEVERAISLKAAMRARDSMLIDHTFGPFAGLELSAVFIERQPASMSNGLRSFHSHATVNVGAQLLYHYAEHNPVTIAPTLKNTVTLYVDWGADMSTGNICTRATRATRATGGRNAAYRQRKKQSVMNLKHLIDIGLLEGIDLSDLPARVHDDIADTIMQGVAWIIRHAVRID